MIASAKRYMTAFAAAALIAVAVSACGGGGGGGGLTVDPPTPEDVALSPLTSGFMANAGTVTIEAGQSTDHGDIAFACATGGADCEVMVMVEANGDVTATSTGGTVTATNSDDYEISLTPMTVDLTPIASGFMVEADTITIEAGQSEDHGDIAFTCAAGGRDCTVMVRVGTGGTAAATSTGGTVSAMNSDAYREALTTRPVSLLEMTTGFMAETGTVTIEAGGTQVYGDIELACGDGRYDCTVMVMVGPGGAIAATTTGGTVSAMNSAAYQEALTTRDVDLSPVTAGFMAQAADAVTIKAGEKKVHGDIEFSCDAGRYDCAVMVMLDSGGTVTATKTGGLVTAMNSGPYQEAVTEKDVDLTPVTDGFMAEAGIVTIEAGGTQVYGDIEFECAEGRYDCEVMVMVADGAITATKIGGTVTAMNAPDYPHSVVMVDLREVAPGFLADADSVTIEAGKSEAHGDILFTCAAGGRDCEVTVNVAAKDDADDEITATKTGGEVTASDAGVAITSASEALEAAIGNGHSANLSPSSLLSSGAPDATLGLAKLTDPSAAKITGWDLSEYVGEVPSTDPALTDTLVIYSNADIVIAKNFAEVHPLNTNMDVGGDYQSHLIDAYNFHLISDTQLLTQRRNGTVTVQFNIGLGSGHSGKFDGADGTYWCNERIGCKLTNDADGNLSTVTGALYFTPGMNAMVDVTNPDYMYFGYWLRGPQDAASGIEREIAGLYGGPKPSDFIDVQQLSEKASYSGSATGQYVRRWVDPSSTDPLRLRTGQFTAKAELTAAFKVGGSVSQNDAFSISGTISEFRDNNRPFGTKAIDPRWRLELERAGIVTDTQRSPGGYYAAVFDGNTQAVDKDGKEISRITKGDWGGQFFGEVDTATNTPPSGVAGTFNGNFTSGEVVGAFGAELQDE